MTIEAHREIKRCPTLVLVDAHPGHIEIGAIRLFVGHCHRGLKDEPRLPVRSSTGGSHTYPRNPPERSRLSHTHRRDSECRYRSTPLRGAFLDTLRGNSSAVGVPVATRSVPALTWVSVPSLSSLLDR